MHKQSFSMQPHTNCHGSVPFPEFALFTCIAVRLCQSGQWLADKMIVAQVGYDYGKRQNISSSTDSARMGQIGERCSKKRNFVSRIDKRLHQATTDPGD
jgi:hypothetical protein